ncbi:hypothetical protein ACKTEK_07170 [Tepidamorphus sp. 3E244]|uniref:hypothetical protein n=1 Tax=Tepidamorphus sp. 3E244 TaxID=3385498 RepID=UPI0038FD173B
MKIDTKAPMTFPIVLAIFAVALAVPAIATGNSGDGSLVSALAPHGAEGKTDRRIVTKQMPASAAATHVEVVGNFGGEQPEIVLLGPDGTEIYRNDPANNLTIVARDAIIPSITVRDDADATAQLLVVAAENPTGANPALDID